MIEFNVPGINRTKTSKIGLIDADFIKYYVLNRLSGDVTSEDVNKETQAVINHLEDLIDAPAMIFCFTGSADRNYRHAVAYEKAYKGNRKTLDSPAVVSIKRDIVDYVKMRYPSLMFSDLEADDIVSMLQDDETFVYSEDKDLKQVPGTHWDIKNKCFYEVTEYESLAFLMKQMLMGDAVDNVAGLRGYGPATCDTLLTNISSLDMPLTVLEQYVNTYDNEMQGIDAFCENWMLLKTRLKRGRFFQELYQEAFILLHNLK